MSGPPLHLLSSMATRQLLGELAACFEGERGTAVRVESVGGVDAAKRVAAGEAFDAVVLASDAIDQLIAAGHLSADGRTDLVRSVVAVAVPAHAAAVDISSEDAVRHAVLAARGIGYSTGPSGTQLLKLFERWGLTAELHGRLVQAPPGVPVGRLVAESRVELGFQQLSELQGLPGITVLGPLPAAIAIITTFTGALSARCGRANEARALLEFMASDATGEVKRALGMQAAPRAAS